MNNNAHNIIKYLCVILCVIVIGSNFIPYRIIDPELAPYEKEFIDTVKEYCPATRFFHPIQDSMYFGNIGYPRLAYTQTNGWTRMTIVVDRFYWATANDDMRYSTLFHELGHGILGLSHSKNSGNFMYAFDFPITKAEVKKQLVEILKERCK